MDQEKVSLEDTPTWAVSLICLSLFLIAFTTETILHHLTEFLRRNKRRSLNMALKKVKTELMIMGSISLLLTIIEVPVSKICISEAVANSFLPCKDPPISVSSDPVISAATEISNMNSTTVISKEVIDMLNCKEKGMVSLLTREGIKQLHFLIFGLAAFHVLYCVLTLFLGSAKMRKWKAWEEETQTLQYQIDNDSRRFQLARQTSFGQRHIQFWTDYILLLWLVCFIRQFKSSVTQADYFTLRNGFIKTNRAGESNFNFQKFLARAFDEDFEKVVGISFWIWLFYIFFIYFSAHDFYNYYWLPFIPLVIVLAVGTKLEVIISKMCLESFNMNSIVRGTYPVKPNDDHFWFGRPNWILNLLQFILIQNSFQLAFFAWTWYMYGPRSCFNREPEDIALRISMGVLVQILCGYVTLPLYALVTQMGSEPRNAVFTKRIITGLKHWQKLARQNLSNNISNSGEHSSGSCTIDNTETSLPDVQNSHILNTEISPPSTSTHITDITEVANPEIITRGSYDGEISFGRSWKNVENRKVVESSTSTHITDITEEANPNTITRGSYDGEVSFGIGWKNVENQKVIESIASTFEDNVSGRITAFED